MGSTGVEVVTGEAIAGAASGDGSGICASANLQENSNPRIRAQYILLCSPSSQFPTQNQEELLGPRKVQRLNNIATKLTDEIADRGAAQ